MVDACMATDPEERRVSKASSGSGAAPEMNHDDSGILNKADTFFKKKIDKDFVKNEMLVSKDFQMKGGNVAESLAFQPHGIPELQSAKDPIGMSNSQSFIRNDSNNLDILITRDRNTQTEFHILTDFEQNTPASCRDNSTKASQKGSLEVNSTVNSIDNNQCEVETTVSFSKVKHVFRFLCFFDDQERYNLKWRKIDTKDDLVAELQFSRDRPQLILARPRIQTQPNTSALDRSNLSGNPLARSVNCSNLSNFPFCHKHIKNAHYYKVLEESFMEYTKK